MSLFDDALQHVKDSPLGQAASFIGSGWGSPGRATFVLEGDQDALDPASDLAGMAADRGAER